MTRCSECELAITCMRMYLQIRNCLIPALGGNDLFLTQSAPTHPVTGAYEKTKEQTQKQTLKQGPGRAHSVVKREQHAIWKRPHALRFSRCAAAVPLPPALERAARRMFKLAG